VKYTEAKLEESFIELLGAEGFEHATGEQIVRSEEEVLIKEDLRAFLLQRYSKEGLTLEEANGIIRKLEVYPATDLYESNKAIMKLVADGFTLKREDRSKKDLWVYLIDYNSPQNNTFKIVNQLEIVGYEKRIPDGTVYINGLPLVVLEFKSAIREEADIYDAWKQLTIRYQRDIPELFKYNAFCVISDGVNNKAGSFFAPYEFYYAWRKIEGMEKEVDGISSLYTMVQGMFNKERLVDIIQNFIFIPDSSKKDEKIVCRYPQYYAAKKLYESIKVAQKPSGDGKGGTYFGATGCGKSFTMLFLTRLLMKSEHFGSPTIIMITDRTDLDDQLSTQFTNAKGYIGDTNVISVESRSELKELLQGRNSGGVFLTTIHKFTEELDKLTDRTNIICISDEAHRSQTNLDQKITTSKTGVKKTYGFAKYLHDSLPNATYVGFTGTPVDATLDVFGDVVDAYTMSESVADEITVRIVYEGRAAKVFTQEKPLKKVEEYYSMVADGGANAYQIDKSKKANTSISVIIGDPDRLKIVAEDFVEHYTKRVEEGASLLGKAIFVCNNREIAYEFYKYVIAIKPEWAEKKSHEEGAVLTDKEKKEIKPMERIKMIMTRDKDDPKALYTILGNKDHRKELDRQFKNEKSNFKIAIVVDMWLTGFDVPSLDTIYIDKFIQKHTLIQTISRVNRKYKTKHKGLVVDYIGIKKYMNQALKKYDKAEKKNFEEIETSIIEVKNHLDLLAKLFHTFDTKPYFYGTSLAQLDCLNRASEFVQITKKVETRFMNIVARLKAAYDICCGSDRLSQDEKDYVHFYLAVRTIVFKLTRGGSPDIAQMNRRVRELIAEAIKSDGVEEIFKIGEEQSEIDLFDEDYLAKLEKIKMPNTKIKLLQMLLAKAIDQVKKVNRIQGIDFTKRFNLVVEKYNERKDADVLRGEVLEDFSNELITLFGDLKIEKDAFLGMGIGFEEKSFYDILKSLAVKYQFEYPEDRLIELAKKVKEVVDDTAKYPDWNKRNDIRDELKVHLIILLAEFGYPPAANDEVYKQVFEQAQNFKRNR